MFPLLAEFPGKNRSLLAYLFGFLRANRSAFSDLGEFLVKNRAEGRDVPMGLRHVSPNTR
jgi:hypothetical protein